MDYKKEYSEYKRIYNVYFNNYKKIETELEDISNKIIEADKTDIEAGRESSEKQELLDQYALLIFKIQLILGDIGKISERLLYIQEAAIRNKTDLQLEEKEITFIKNLSVNSGSTFVIEGEELKEKTAGLEDIIKKRVKDTPEKRQMYLDAIRNSKRG